MKLNLKFNEGMKLPINYEKSHWSIRKQAREEYVRIQKGLCHYCKRTLSEQAPIEIRRKKLDRGAFPRGFWVHPVHLHHCHDTGLTIGAVHNYCNAVLWQYHGE